MSSSPKIKSKKGKTWEDTDGTGDRHSFMGLSGELGKYAAMLGVLMLILLPPIFTIYMSVIHIQFNGSIQQFLEYASEQKWAGIRNLWPLPSLEAWAYIAGFGVIQGLMQVFLPGRIVSGPTTPKGNVPQYKANGVLCFATSILLFCIAWRFGIIRPARVYDLCTEILSGLNIFGFVLVLGLMYKGLHFPSTSDCGSTGYLIYDIYWGTELYPRIGKQFDIKTWTNCRMGMMLWAILPLCYAAKQLEQYGLVADSLIVNIIITEAYVFKFFLWEAGYWRTMDIAHDRAGFYLCWGCLNWVPAVYTSPSLYLAGHPYLLGNWIAAAVLMMGVAMVYINYDCDRQRQHFRATDGKCIVWGKEPRMVEASYSAGGQTRVNKLLASGWWGISRHFHYVPEILASFFWTLPGGFAHMLPWFYTTFLTILLIDRTFRDDERCRAKYGKYWEAYCSMVPYKVIPYVF